MQAHDERVGRTFRTVSPDPTLLRMSLWCLLRTLCVFLRSVKTLPVQLRLGRFSTSFPMNFVIHSTEVCQRLRTCSHGSVIIYMKLWMEAVSMIGHKRFAFSREFPFSSNICDLAESSLGIGFHGGNWYLEILVMKQGSLSRHKQNLLLYFRVGCLFIYTLQFCSFTTV